MRYIYSLIFSLLKPAAVMKIWDQCCGTNWSWENLTLGAGRHLLKGCVIGGFVADASVEEGLVVEDCVVDGFVVDEFVDGAVINEQSTGGLEAAHHAAKEAVMFAARSESILRSQKWLSGNVRVLSGNITHVPEWSTFSGFVTFLRSSPTLMAYPAILPQDSSSAVAAGRSIPRPPTLVDIMSGVDVWPLIVPPLKSPSRPTSQAL